jgi:hypothetical protein
MDNQQTAGKDTLLKPTTRGERVMTIAIMIIGIGVSQILLGCMIFRYTFSWYLFLGSLVTGPGALWWGFSNYRTSKLWSYLEKQAESAQENEKDNPPPKAFGSVWVYRILIALFFIGFVYRGIVRLMEYLNN